MKKILAILVSAMGFVYSYAQNNHSFWTDFASRKYEKAKTISFTLIYSKKLVDTTYIDTSYVEADSSEVTMLQNGAFALRVSNDSLWLVDELHGNISFGPREYQIRKNGMNMYYYIRDHYQHKLIMYAPFYLNPSYTNLFAETDSVYHTFLGDTSYFVAHQHMLTGHQYNEQTEQYDIPITDSIIMYCNDRSHLVDKIVVFHGLDTTYYEEFRFCNVMPFKQRNIDSNIFDINSPSHANYTKYNYTQTVAPSLIGTYTGNTDMTNELMNYPLVGYDGDTTYLRQSTGWVLIDLWIYGCPPCVSFLKHLQKEVDSLGYRQIEKEGVRLYCINPKGGVTPQFRKYAERWAAQDILYSARGIGSELKASCWPSIYLFAPNGDLVFHNECEYIPDLTETIIKMKHDYENHHDETNKQF